MQNESHRLWPLIAGTKFADSYIIDYDNNYFNNYNKLVENFENIPKEKLKVLLDYKNKTSLKTLINSHIINGNLDSSTLKNNIDNNNGAYTFKAISGASLTASLNGDKIIIKDENGVAAQLEVSDVISSNGVFHLMSSVLGLY